MKKTQISHEQSQTSENPNGLVMSADEFAERLFGSDFEKKKNLYLSSITRGLSHEEAINESGLHPKLANQFYSVLRGDMDIEDINFFVTKEVSEVESFLAHAMSNETSIPLHEVEEGFLRAAEKDAKREYELRKSQSQEKL
jgi:hypothetical protein